MEQLDDGLWIWRTEHPHWRAGHGWDRTVTSTCVELGSERLVIDPLASPNAWEHLDVHRPTAIVILKPDHVRDVDAFVERYRVPAFGPDRFDRHDIPETELAPIFPGSQLPGGAIALDDGRWRNETPLWLPEHETIIFADALTAPRGVLRVWATPWHETRALPVLRELLALPFERVIVSHGDPVHTRAAFEQALEIAPWTGHE